VLALREALTSERINAMTDTIDDLDRTDEETLTCEVADEALETAAGATRAVITAGTWGGPYPCALS
jgi:hypothetical protein